MDGSPQKHRWQFSLYGLFAVMTASAIYVALLANFPRLAAAIGFCLLTATLLYIADRLVAAGTTPAGARAIVLITVFAGMLVGAGLLLIAGTTLFFSFVFGDGVVPSPVGLMPWVIAVPLAGCGIICLIAARNASRNRRRGHSLRRSIGLFSQAACPTCR